MRDSAAAFDRSRPKRKHREDSLRTQKSLLEAAGQVFASKGFDRAMGKEICARAGTNAAAINYHFGGIEGLYAAVLNEAHRNVGALETLSAALAGPTGAKAKLRAIIELGVQKLIGPTSSSWMLGVLSRELLAPSPAGKVLLDKQGVPKGRILKSIIGELMDLPEDHPSVDMACLCISAPFLVLLIADRRTLKRVFPALEIGLGATESLSRQIFEQAISCAAALSRDARKAASMGHSLPR